MSNEDISVNKRITNSDLINKKIIRKELLSDCNLKFSALCEQSELNTRAVCHCFNRKIKPRKIVTGRGGSRDFSRGGGKGFYKIFSTFQKFSLSFLLSRRY